MIHVIAWQNVLISSAYLRYEEFQIKYTHKKYQIHFLLEVKFVPRLSRCTVPLEMSSFAFSDKLLTNAQSSVVFIARVQCLSITRRNKLR